MQTTVLLGALLFLLPLGSIGESSHEIVKRSAEKAHWNYEEDAGPDKWKNDYKTCKGERQSPINIITSELDFNEELNGFEFENYDDPLEDAIIHNNGHTIEILPNKNDEPRRFDEGGRDDKYRFLKAHFHWGSDNKKGSEHTIDGKSFPLELHLVHMNENYKEYEQALKKEDGLAVLAVLYKLSHEDNPDLEPIIDKLDEVRKENAKAEMVDFTLESLLPDNTMPYYRYGGSLTTPGCNEVVTWTIFKEHVPISEKQLMQFRNVKEEEEGEPEEALVNNFRPTQNLNTRVVEISGNSASVTTNSASFGASVVTVLAVLSFLL